MGWGPQQKIGAIALTFDNFGEAFDVQQGKWPAAEPFGNHYTAVTVLPRLLADLAKVEITATFFVEAWNAEVNPKSLRAMKSAGHEVALHGWQHELWFRQSPTQRKEILDKCLAAAKTLDILPAGLRPPGGLATDDTDQLLRAAGLSYQSAAGEGVSVANDIASLPFRWTDVDALYLEPQLAVVRKELYGSEDLKTLGDWQDVLSRVIQEALDQRTCRTLIFHPYLLGEDPERYDVFLEFLKKLGDADDLWIAPCTDIADWLRENRDRL